MHFFKKLMIFFCGIQLVFLTKAAENQERNKVISTELYYVLNKKFLLNADCIDIIANKLENNLHLYLHDFLYALQKLSSYKIGESISNPFDAVIVDPEHHQVIAENDFIRVLWVTLKVGVRMPTHIDQWPIVMLITKGSKFLIHRHDGSTIEGEWEAGVYEFEPENVLIGFTNIGDQDFEAFAIELKLTLPN